MANKKFQVPVNLVNLASDPASASEGDIYYNTTSDAVKVYANGAWVAIGSGGGGGSASDSFKTISVTGQDSVVADSSTDTLSLVAGTNVSITTDATTDSITINSAGTYTSVDSITYPDYITFDTTPETIPTASGSLYWDSGDGVLETVLNANVSIGIGQEQVALVKNATGSSIAKGKVVYISGAQGQRPTITLSDADTETTSSKTFGVTAETIADGAEGYVTTFGVLRGVNTDGLTEGGAIWLSQTAGNFTQTIPAEPAHAVFIGYVVKAHASSGEIFVNVQNGYELTELHGVIIEESLADNEVLAYDLSSGLWKNQTAPEAGLIDTSSTEQTKTGNLIIGGNLTANGTTIPSSKTLVVTTDIGTSVQAYSATLAGINTLGSGTGFLKNTAGTWSYDTNTYLTGSNALYVGTTSISLNRSSASQSLTGITSIDGSAASLTTSRTLWGQSFNGTANITGDLTSVGNITGTGAITIQSGGTNTDITIKSIGNGNTYLDTASANGSVYIGTTATYTYMKNVSISGDLISSYLNTSGQSGTTPSNNIAIATGYQDGTAATGNITIRTGQAFGNQSGSITVDSGAASTAAGTINIGTANSPTINIGRTGSTTTINGTFNTTAINGTTIPTSKTLVVTTDIGSLVQAYDADLTSIAALTGSSGFLKTNGSGTWTVDTNTYALNSALSSYATLSGATFTGNIAINNGTSTAITTTGTTAKLFNGNATTIEIGHAATTLSIGDIGHTGTTTINNDLAVYGSITFSQGASSLSATTIQIDDTLISLADNNTADILDVGFYAGYRQASTDYHTGFVRDASDSGKWKLFAGVTAQPTGTVDFTSATYGTLKIGILEVDSATLTTTQSNLGLAIGTNVQAYDADLAAIAALTGTSGLLKKTAADTWALDTSTYLTSAVTSITAGTGLSGGTITSTGTIALATAYGDTVNPYASKTANYVLASPNGSAGAPTFRALVAADIPSLSYAPNAFSTIATTSGTSPVADSTTDTLTLSAGTGITVTGNATTDTITIANAGVTSINGTLTGAVTGIATTADDLSQFASTTSAQLAALLSDETGTGLVVFNNSPSLTSPTISGGTINNTPIGATTASTGKFTSVDVDGLLLIDTSTGTTSATSSFNTTTYSSAEFIIYGSTSTGKYVSKVLMLANGSSTPDITEYAILTQGTAPTVTITASYSAPNAVLTVAVTSGTAIRIVRTAVVI